MKQIDIYQELYPEILRGLSAYYDSPLLRSIARTAERYPSLALSNALNRNQIICKRWLIDELHNAIGGRFERIWVLGGWYGVLAALLFEDQRFEIGEIVNIDLDPDCAPVAECLNRDQHRDGRFRTLMRDMCKLDYGAGRADAPSLIINTCCEHLSDFAGWFDLVPSGTNMVLQSNNYFGEPDHVNCLDSLQQFEAEAAMSRVLYSGELELPNYTRFMLIGQK